MRLLIPVLAVVAYREAFRFSAERARELDAVDVERWFFIPDETAPSIVFLMAGWLLYRRLPRSRQIGWKTGPPWLTALLLAVGTGFFLWSTYAHAPDLLALSLCLNAFGLAALLGGLQAMRAILVPGPFLLFAVLGCPPVDGAEECIPDELVFALIGDRAVLRPASVSPVPEPAARRLAVSALAVLAWLRRRSVWAGGSGSRLAC